ILVSNTARSNCLPLNPDATILIRNGDIIQDIAIISRDTSIIIFSKLFACFLLPSLPSLDSISYNTGIIVVLIDFVIITLNNETVVNAIKKVSVSNPDPNFAAINISRINPNILLPKVNIIIITTDLTAFLDFDITSSVDSYIELFFQPSSV